MALRCPGPGRRRYRSASGPARRSRRNNGRSSAGSSAHSSGVDRTRWWADCRQAPTDVGHGQPPRREAEMKQIRVERPKRQDRRADAELLPLDARDADIVRAKALSRAAATRAAEPDD